MVSSLSSQETWALNSSACTRVCVRVCVCFHLGFLDCKIRKHIWLSSPWLLCVCVCVRVSLTNIAVLSNQLQCQLVCQHGGVAMGDVGKGPSVDEHWSTLGWSRAHKHRQKLEALTPKTRSPLRTSRPYTLNHAFPPPPRCLPPPPSLATSTTQLIHYTYTCTSISMFRYQ